MQNNRVVIFVDDAHVAVNWVDIETNHFSYLHCNELRVSSRHPTDSLDFVDGCWHAPIPHIVSHELEDFLVNIMVFLNLLLNKLLLLYRLVRRRVHEILMVNLRNNHLIGWHSMLLAWHLDLSTPKLLKLLTVRIILDLCYWVHELEMILVKLLILTMRVGLMLRHCNSVMDRNWIWIQLHLTKLLLQLELLVRLAWILVLLLLLPMSIFLSLIMLIALWKVHTY